jgi:hypothetical protein|tara:strand:- start:55 stop:219 length:165 start_codon:yes stop_codon:yes gene_type:complete
MNIARLEKEIVKAIDVEKSDMNNPETLTTQATLNYNFNDLKNFVQKLFKEHNNN